MLPAVDATLEVINRAIWDCKKCLVLSHYRANNRPFRPEPFTGYNRDNEYRMLYIAINPGWNRNNEKYYESKWRGVYNTDNYENYKEEYVKAWTSIDKNKTGKDVTDNFSITLSRMANAVRREFCPDIEELNQMNYEHHVFRAQLSYCSSNKPKKRIITGFSMPESWKGIFAEQGEVETCLKSNYLKDIVKCLDPKVILFLGQYSRDHFTCSDFKYLSVLLDKDIEAGNGIHQETFELRKGTGVMKGCVTADKTQKILFLPHPCARIKSLEEVETNITKLCRTLN
jgi:hypothetical protein